MSLFGALLAKAPDPPKTPVPMVGRASGGLFGAFMRQSGAASQLSAMEAVGTVFGIVDKLANATSRVEWHLWKKAKSGKKEDRTEVTSHAALDIWNKPNSFTTRQELVEMGQQHGELMGETWLVVARDPRARSLPLELWEISPDRMEPVPSAERFLAGYLYRSPDGEMVPLERQDVLFARRPDPRNPYRGLGPIKPALIDIDSARYAAEWNRNFFLNSAEPGGIVEVDRRLSDDEFNELVARWREQHQGVAQAHRVAVLEQVKWVDRKYTMRDMQFTELRGVTSAAIREAFGFPKFMLGQVDDVNRANAEASEAMFAQWLVVPRLERWKQLLNNDFLPLFGTSSSGLEFDYDDPVPANSEAENAARTSKVQAATSLLSLTTVQFDPAKTLAAFDLPDIPFEKPAPPPAAAPPGAPTDGGFAPAPDEQPQTPAGDPVLEQLLASTRRRVLAQAPPDDADLRLVQSDWESALDATLADWGQITDQQRQQVRAQVGRAVAAGDVAALAELSVSSSAGAAVLADALAGLWSTSGDRMAAELAVQGAPPVVPPGPDEVGLGAQAKAAASLLAAGYVAVAAREAVRAYRPGVSPAVVVAAVDGALEGLSDRSLKDQLGGALSRAQNQARLLTARQLELDLGGSPGDPDDPEASTGDDDHVPQVKYFASEVNDKNTCWPCHQVDGEEYERWIDAWVDYAGGIYRGCLGGLRCRGTVKARWNPAAGQ